VNVYSERRTVLVVDDSALVRRVVSDVIDATMEFRVVATARDGLDALQKVHALDPDLVTLDVHMPALDGLQTLGYIMSETPRPVVILSAADARTTSDLTIRALELGAVDFVQKPRAGDSLDEGLLRERLVAALRAARDADPRRVSVLARPPTVQTSVTRGGAASRVVAIAASTGGPRALATLIPALPNPLGAAVIVVQHMPAGFTESLARRLDTLSPLPVTEARDGTLVESNHVYVAPGGYHVRVVRRNDAPILALSEEAPIWGVRPSADPLFVSVAQAFRANAMGVVLTGMGRDGAEGLKEIRSAGGFAVVQDNATSIVNGMPQSALDHAGADVISSISDMAGAVVLALAGLGGPRSPTM
jgi:two-component system, chemotaxis family, protein-glutamate methylesterase/glutaminase